MSTFPTIEVIPSAGNDSSLRWWCPHNNCDFSSHFTKLNRLQNHCQKNHNFTVARVKKQLSETTKKQYERIEKRVAAIQWTNRAL